jgi:hypothetical protein
MLFSFIDALIDRRVSKSFTKLRKIGRRGESVYGGVYKSWLYYISRRSKDPYIKLNIGVMLGCYMLIYRAFRRSYTDSEYSKRTPSYPDVLEMLKHYNRTGSTLPDFAPYEKPQESRKEAKDQFDFSLLRFF